MKFFAVFASLLVVTCAYQTKLPTVASGDHELTSWTLHELSEALQDSNTPEPLLPYLEHALNTIMDGLMAGAQQDTIIVATPVGLIPSVAPVASVVAPTTVVENNVAASSSPLVQIIVNIKQQEASAPAPVPTPVPAPAPVPVNPVDVIAITPPEFNPVDVIAIQPPTQVINPVDVIAITPPEVNPVDVIAINPPTQVINPVDVIAITPPEVNPVDVIAINPPQINPLDVIAVSAPDVNPIDILHPIPTVPGSVSVVGPIL